MRVAAAVLGQSTPRHVPATAERRDMTFTRQSGGGLLFLTEICGNGSLFDYYATKVTAMP